MTKLQKRPPPAYPGLSTDPRTIDEGIRYESLPRFNKPPRMIDSTASEIAVVGGLGRQDQVPNSRQPEFALTLSPFDKTKRRTLEAATDPLTPPIMMTQTSSRSRASSANAQLQTTNPQRPHSSSAKMRELRRLDGNPYGPSVRVATDMHGGALPPQYKRQQSETNSLLGPGQMQASASNVRCVRCGKASAAGSGPQGRCEHCGQQRASAPTQLSPQIPLPARFTQVHVRSASEGTLVLGRPMPEIQNVAGPSTSQNTTHPARCNKCHKPRRPESVLLQQAPFQSAAPSRVSDSTDALKPRPLQPSLNVQPLRMHTQPQVEIVPASAVTNHSTQSPWADHDDVPLVAKATKTESRKLSGGSITRTLSKLRRNRPEPRLPSQQLEFRGGDTGEQSAGRLINMISGFTHSSSDKHSRLSPATPPNDRPGSPFSFVDGPDEQQAFEMVGLGLDKKKSSLDGKEEMTVETQEVAQPVNPSTYLKALPENATEIDSAPRNGLLSPPLSQPNGGRPGGLTRFKSLRGGVTRLNSIGRSKSLKRLGSIHRNWYRDDMAIEGAMGENHNIPVY